MAFLPFWDESLTDEVVELTNGSLVEYRGAQFQMHCESPTAEVLTAFETTARGIAVVLIGARSRFPAVIERGDLITVDGDDYVIGDYRHSDDGEDIFVYLTRTTRTGF